MTSSDDRFLYFFVSGALLAGSAACTKNPNESESEVKINTGNHETHVNEGPINQAVPTPSQQVEEPTHVNTIHVKEPSAAVPHKTNTGRQVEPAELENKPDDTNTGRQVEPVSEEPPLAINIGLKVESVQNPAPQPIKLKLRKTDVGRKKAPPPVSPK